MVRSDWVTVSRRRPGWKGASATRRRQRRVVIRQLLPGASRDRTGRIQGGSDRLSRSYPRTGQHFGDAPAPIDAREVDDEMNGQRDRFPRAAMRQPHVGGQHTVREAVSACSAEFA